MIASPARKRKPRLRKGDLVMTLGGTCVFVAWQRVQEVDPREIGRIDNRDGTWIVPLHLTADRIYEVARARADPPTAYFDGPGWTDIFDYVTGRVLTTRSGSLRRLD